MLRVARMESTGRREVPPMTGSAKCATVLLTGKNPGLRYAPSGLLRCRLKLQGLNSCKGRHDMKVREVIRLIEADGWFVVATRGSHRQYKHPAKAASRSPASRRTIWRPAL